MRRNALRIVSAIVAVTSVSCVVSCGGDEREHLASVEQSLSTGVVISQVYGGAGNTTPTYSSDYVELFNRGTTSVSVSGWTVQYASAASPTWAIAVTLPAASIPPGGYYLVKLQTSAEGAAVPTGDVTGTTPVSILGGKVAVVASATTLTCTSCASAANVRDLVGYGTSLDFEGTGTAPANSSTTATLRKTGGCTETDNNATDFAAGAPTPRNSSTAAAPCVTDAGVDTGPPDTGTPDTGTPDTGPPDTGTPDTGTRDTGTPDTGTPDTGTPDTGSADTGTTADTAVADSGIDSSAADLGVVDAGADARSDATDATTTVDTAPTEDTASLEDTAIAEDTLATDADLADLGVDAEKGELDLPAAEPTCSCRTPAGPASSTAELISLGLVVACATRLRRRPLRAGRRR